MTEQTVHTFEQRARTGNFLPVVLKNWLLGLITLTLYRFWGRTEMRRRLWSTTYFMGDALEYTGSGWELFKGFLISLPVFFGPAIFIFYIAPLMLPPEVSTSLFFGFWILSTPLIAMAVYLMRRYQLSRTRWRGVKFHLGGSAVAFGFASMWLSILEGITWGWFAPAARMRRAKMLWENARFGDQPFEFATGEQEYAKGLYGPFALGWFGMVISFVAALMVVGVLAMAVIGSNFGTVDFEEMFSDPDPAVIGAIVGLYVAFFLIWALLATIAWMPYEAAATNRTAELLTIDGARFRLKTTTMGLFGVTLAQLFVTLLTIGVLAPLGAMWRVRYVMNRLALVGDPRLAEIGQSTAAGPSQGEGIADAFDMDIGLGVL